MLTPEMLSIIKVHPLGFVASLNADGTPNLSPKGTFLALDDTHVAFGHIRSPRTVANLKRNPVLEICFLDVLARKSVKVRGSAEIIERDSEGGRALDRAFEAWGEYAPLIKAYVRVTVTSAALITSPGYDIGHTAEELRAQYKAKYQAL